ncbi:MAG TPA: four helix bundle protein [Pyrinomonadaceae bacterium]|nr:four helix bundle protein [Pyrinomonadaceae bacterium]
MAKIERFEDIESWKKSRELAKSVYRITLNQPFARDFGLRDQIRRASVSILSNIAEGFERDGDKEFVQFLSLAKGSCGEVRAQLYVALDQQYIAAEEFSSLSASATEISRMLSGLIKYLRQSGMQGRKYR